MAYPLDFMTPKLPGLGNVDWGKYVSALTDIGYDGYTCIEIEDKAFEGSKERILDSLRLSKRYMEQFVDLTAAELLDLFQKPEPVFRLGRGSVFLRKRLTLPIA